MGKSKKKHGGNKEGTGTGKKLSPQAKLQLMSFIDDLLYRCTALQNNVQREWEEFQDIYNILQKIREIEQGMAMPNWNREEHWDAFLTWCKEHGSSYDNIEIKKLSHGDYGVFAKADIKEGSLVLSVPRKLMMSTLTATESKLGPLINKDPIMQHMPNIVLALHLLAEFASPESFWKPYIYVLPTEYNNPLYFTLEEIMELKGSPTFDEAIKHYRNIARQYAYFFKLLMTNSDAKLQVLKTHFTFEMYRWAAATVMTRQNSVPSPDGLTAITSLVPLWDMCNHACGRLSTDYDLNKDQLECMAMQDFAAGEEVRIFYGARSNAEFFIHNGFVYPENEHDSVGIRLGISRSDPLYASKEELCGKLNLPVCGTFYLRRGSKPVDARTLAFLQVFLMKEDDLEKCLRDGPDSVFEILKNISGPLNFLATRISLLLKTYPTTIEEDEALLQTEDLTTRRRMVVQLRLCEKRLFQWALRVCQQVPS